MHPKYLIKKDNKNKWQTKKTDRNGHKCKNFSQNLQKKGRIKKIKTMRTKVPIGIHRRTDIKHAQQLKMDKRVKWHKHTSFENKGINWGQTKSNQ